MENNLLDSYFTRLGIYTSNVSKTNSELSDLLYLIISEIESNKVLQDLTKGFDKSAIELYEGNIDGSYCKIKMYFNSRGLSFYYEYENSFGGWVRKPLLRHVNRLHIKIIREILTDLPVELQSLLSEYQHLHLVNAELFDANSKILAILHSNQSVDL